MEVSEPVYHVTAFTNSNLISVACESGKMCIYDTETSNQVYSAKLNDACIITRVYDDNTVYSATENDIFFHDIRAKKPTKIITHSPSEISDFVINGELIAIATYSHDIILSDKRCLRKAKSSGILPSVCSSLQFTSKSTLVAGYIDTTLGIWNFDRNKFLPFKLPPPPEFNPSVVHCVAAQNEYTVAAHQNGIYVYKNLNMVCDSKFEHDGAVETICFAPCFENGPFVVSGASDGSIMVLDISTQKPLDCLTMDDEKIQCVTANNKFIGVADTSDNGKISIFFPDDFGHNEEEEEEEDKKEKKTNNTE